MISIPPTTEPEQREAKTLALDEVSFRAFYDDALPRVYGYLLHRCGGIAAVAEELTQETFVAAVRELRRGRRVDAAIPWIYGIARHKLIDHYRVQERAERRRAPETTESGAGTGDDIGERLSEALESLPVAQRAALVLRHGDGCSVPEIAEALGRSVEAVESLLVRARIGFKRAYREPR